MKSAPALYNQLDIKRTGVINSVSGNNSFLQSKIINAVGPGISQVQKIAPEFVGSNDLETARNVWQFCQDQITYLRDYSAQKIKLPSAFLRDQTGDCKSYAVFIASILSALNIPNYIVFTAYNGNTTPSHVYNAIRIGHQYYPIDGTIRKFGYEKTPSYKKIIPMRINTIAGPEDIQSPYILGYSNNNSINGKAAEKWQKIKDDIKKAVTKVVQTGKTVGLAPARIAFLGLVKINVHRLATHLQTIISKGGPGAQELKNRWQKLGGDFSQFQKVINEGAKNKPIFGPDDAPETESINGPTIAAALAAAVPVLLAILPLIKSFAGGTAAKDADNIDKDLTNQEPPDTVPDYGAGSQAPQRPDQDGPAPTDNAPKQDTPKDAPKTADKKSNTALMLGLGALALIALTK